MSNGFIWLWTGASGGIFMKTAMKLRLAGGQATLFLRINYEGTNEHVCKDLM